MAVNIVSIVLSLLLHLQTKLDLLDNTSLISIEDMIHYFSCFLQRNKYYWIGAINSVL
jgi:hypothetical protein